MKPVLAFTMGDPAGIGPEVLVAALEDLRVRRACSPIVIGARRALERAGWRPRLAPLLDPGVSAPARQGRPTAEGGRASFAAVRLALELAARGLVRGIVTAPVSKTSWTLAAVPYLDHTHYLGSATGSSAQMMLVADGMRAVLVTRHAPLRQALRLLTPRAVAAAALAAARALREGLGIRRPRLGLCALNPHAGEGGLLGSEEARCIAPAARRLRRAGIAVEGPLPADAAWADHRRGRYDALVALYHDQALIPLKLADPYGVVNWTLGIPLVRTSPGHGTAFDIAGRRRARHDAMAAAALLAARLAGRRA